MSISWLDTPVVALSFLLIFAACAGALIYNQIVYNQVVRLLQLKRDMRRAKSVMDGEIDMPLAAVQPAPLTTA